MTALPSLTDRAALARQRARAARAPESFLHEAAIGEVEDRLAVVNKSFSTTAIVTGHPEIWRPAFPDALCVEDAETLALEEGMHDLVIHAMALHWANDPVGQIIQCRRALRPDGLFLAVCFGGGALSELRASLAQAESEVTGGLAPRVAPMGEVRELGALLQRAGLALPVADTVPLSASYADMTALMHDLRAMGETNAMAARPRHFTRRAILRRAAEIYRDAFAMPDGRLRASYDLTCLTGWAPHASQPKPLRPGSAGARLADALGTEETSLD
ncbi:methyltransferase domain-containing protein [Roseovarius spongiae]|uniref:Methyltransferase domain-containing protein n=1 Tax=Roseovarius spongiae TaxID=2320272 RepID=A0A3A8ARQ4_9RHOB|nr:methyltransferase domain-containing protein [Roseovarius spongiae]RKF13610.1 methyltransferase domain-containing protein [Roseovarius spongiae]